MFKLLTQLIIGKNTNKVRHQNDEEQTKLMESISIDEMCKENSVIFYWLPNDLNKKVVEIFNNEIHIDIDECDDVNILNILATYHYYVTKDYTTMKKILQKGCKLNSDISMIKLAQYHNYHEIDYRIVTSLYERAIKLGNIIASINMADYYFNIGCNEEMGERMLLKLADDGEILAMLKLVEYYKSKKQYHFMTTYIILALKCENSKINNCNRPYLINAMKTLKSICSENIFNDILRKIENPNDVILSELNMK